MAKRPRFSLDPSNTLILTGIPENIHKEELIVSMNDFANSLSISPPYKIALKSGVAFVNFTNVYSCSIVYSSIDKFLIRNYRVEAEYGQDCYDSIEKTDWTCNNVKNMQCGTLNFARRLKCFKCTKIKTNISDENIKATIIVKGIYQLSENEIWESLDKIAKVKDIRRIKDRFTGDFKDFAFVEFVTESEADFVVDLSLKTTLRISGRPVNVSKSKKKRVGNEVHDSVEEKPASKPESTEKFCNFEKLYRKSEFQKPSSAGNKTLSQDPLKHKEKDKQHCQKQTETAKKLVELENVWKERLKSNISICFKCNKWFSSVELGRLHDLCHK
ncbi:hypothetical protein SteCoe_6785 [Stentor coeruleus]|uniref:RRM domain-containing protein n=1 Tax=Stentor coeruleus TaxID=5963 RepID=A0A1R2CP81_9CILI|nr:hypothetical protein SteCoe_6785 [Stentor coeruleus]